MVTKQKSKLPVIALSLLLLIAAVAAAAEAAYLGACFLGRRDVEAALEELHGDGGTAFYDLGRGYAFRDDIVALLLLGIEKDGDETRVVSLKLCALDEEAGTATVVSIPPELETRVRLRDEYGASTETELAAVASAYGNGEDSEDGRQLTADAVSERLRGLPIAGSVELDERDLDDLMDELEKGADEDPLALARVIASIAPDTEGNLSWNELVYLASAGLLDCRVEFTELEGAPVDGEDALLRADGQDILALLKDIFCREI